MCIRDSESTMYKKQESESERMECDILILRSELTGEK